MREFGLAGGLMSYDISNAEVYRQVALLVARIGELADVYSVTRIGFGSEARATLATR